MDRRSTLAAIMGKKTHTAEEKLPLLGGSLAPYTGPWTSREAGHLLRRATFGPSQSMINEAAANGLQWTLDQLFGNASQTPEPPVKFFLDGPHPLFGRVIPNVEDPEVSYGETWVNAKIVPSVGGQQAQQINNYRTQSMYGWLYKLMNEPVISIREKMLIFWHNHFVVSEFRLPHMMYQYMATLYQHVIGDFRQLTKDITIDPAMLLYLNGNENTAAAPNENYARELLELFTIGKGDLAGPGDYTNYTEDDVLALSKALTGWTLDFGSLQRNQVDVIFYGFNHDRQSKTLSHRFNNAVINNNGQNEYKDVVDIIFQQDEVSRFICRKLYRYFVHYDITPAIESDVIEPMAQILRDNNYVIEPALKALLGSEHFFSEEAIGCMIKNPTDFLISTVKGLNYTFDEEKTFLNIPDGLVTGPVADYMNSLILALLSGESEMYIFNHPDVAGWKAYYQAPTYYRTWINTVTLPIRVDQSSKFVNGGRLDVGNGGYEIKDFVPVLEIVAGIQGAEDPNVLINKLADQVFPYGVTDGQKDYLKEILIPGLPDFEWTVEYTDYLADPDNRQKREAVTNRLRALFTSLLEMPEAQLM